MFLNGFIKYKSEFVYGIFSVTSQNRQPGPLHDDSPTSEERLIYVTQIHSSGGGRKSQECFPCTFHADDQWYTVKTLVFSG